MLKVEIRSLNRCIIVSPKLGLFNHNQKSSRIIANRYDTNVVRDRCAILVDSLNKRPVKNLRQMIAFALRIHLLFNTYFRCGGYQLGCFPNDSDGRTLRVITSIPDERCKRRMIYFDWWGKEMLLGPVTTIENQSESVLNLKIVPWLGSI